MTKRTEFRCDACNQSLNKVPLAPMLRDGVWNSVAGPQEDVVRAVLVRTHDQRPRPHALLRRSAPVSTISCTHHIPGSTCSSARRSSHLFSMMSGTRCLGNRLRSTASEREGLNDLK